MSAALQHRDFRVIFIGQFASVIGSWMQTVVLPAYIDGRTQSAMWVGLFVFAQMGPTLLLSIPGGMLVDKFPARGLLVTMQAGMMIASAALAVMVTGNGAAIPLIWLAQLVAGTCNALSAPVLQGTIPNMVPTEDLPGLIALNSAMVNGGRVIGPVIAAILMSRGMTTSQILLLNAVTFLFVIGAMYLVKFPVQKRATDARGLGNVLAGLAIARRRSIIGRLLLGMAVFSFICLPWIGLFPSIARLNFGIDPRSATYKWLYAVWGIGALSGALLVGTVLAQTAKERLIRPAFLFYAVAVGAFGLIHSPALAFPIAFLVGVAYFAQATSMLTVIQQNLLGHERARVMSLWFMAFGGTISISNLVFAPMVDHLGARPVMLIAAVGAALLAWWCDPLAPGVVNLADETGGSGGSAARQGRGDDAEASNKAPLDEHGFAVGD